ncbi:hypothetical protein ACHAW6_007992 [Cyclotella cf. meneghiniana]
MESTQPTPMSSTMRILLLPLALAHCFHNPPSSSSRTIHRRNVPHNIARRRSTSGTRRSLAAAPLDTPIPSSPPNLIISSINTIPSSSEDAFAFLSSLSATTLLQSDRRRDALGRESGAQASSATNWIDEGSAFRLRSFLNRLELRAFVEDEKEYERRDEAAAWVRWMRSVPRPVVVDLSSEARMAANETVSDEFLMLLNLPVEDGGVNVSEKVSPNKMRQIRNDFLSRIGCKLILLPSGQTMRGSLLEPNGSLIFGKLLYGGVTRYRILPTSAGGNADAAPKPPRRAGERTERKTAASQNIPCWVQYGGTERRYDAVDMGPAMVLEVSLAPKIQTVNNHGFDKNGPSVHAVAGTKGDMMLHRLAWNPKFMFRYVEPDEAGTNRHASNDTKPITSSASTLQGRERNEAFASDFRHRVGGLGPQIDAIVRRVLDGRVIRPAEVDANGNLLSFRDAKELTGKGQQQDGFHLEDSSKLLSMAALEAQELEILGLTPVKGLLLYGPPGCGKTALAREIARALKARAPKIVAAPELLDRWVGGSERLVRELFHDAEAELAACNGDATRSALHVIVIDEIDAVFRKRSSAEDSGEATRSSTVNQILAKLDGVQAIPNVLLIGMTNRRELLDEALLRPGRLEVQIEIPLPSREGRREILQIHTDALRRKGRLSHPLCCAIDGVRSAYAGETGFDESNSADEVTPEKSRGRKRRAIKRATSSIIDYIAPGKNAVYDLADDRVTGGYSGAELAGLVRCAGSIALSRARKQGGGVDSLLITLDDVKQALSEVKD